MFSLWATRYLEDGVVHLHLDTVDTATGDVIQVLNETQAAEIQSMLGRYPGIAYRTPNFVYITLGPAGNYLLEHFPDTFSHMVHYDPRLLTSPLKTNIHTDLPPCENGPGPLCMRVPAGEPLPILMPLLKE